jgi:hypothetical protein
MCTGVTAVVTLYVLVGRGYVSAVAAAMGITLALQLPSSLQALIHAEVRGWRIDVYAVRVGM